MAFERYSYIGNNRLSLNVCVVANEDNIYLNATSTGGSQAVFFKVNIFGERNFVNEFERQIDQYIARN